MMDLAPIVMIVLLGVAVYLPLFLRAEGFCFDDVPLGRSIAAWPAMEVRRFVSAYLLSPHRIRAVWWAWLRLLSVVCQTSRRAWVAASVACHLVNAILLFVLAEQIGATRWQAWSAAALFAVHPMAVLTAAFIGGTPSALVLTGILAGLLCLERGAAVAAVLIGVITSGIKLDGWTYWPTAGLWLVLR
ncbi:MAG TPA: hypothetical protein VEA16_21965 [Vicinamibacterales bacterium]|nr:hypothetical protein [Vicinamibacterales bacterium]